MSSRINARTRSKSATAAEAAEAVLERQAAQVAHTNFMGMTSYAHGSPLATLRMAAASCFFGEPQYYEGKDASRALTGPQEYLQQTLGEVVSAQWQAMGSRQRMEHAIDQALDFDAEGTLLIAVALRNEDHIRVTPQVIMVRAAYHPKVSGTGLVAKYARQIMRRGDEPATQLAYVRSAFAGKPIVNALRKAWASFLSEQSEYSLAKYRLEARAVKTVDVVNLVRPKPTEALGKLVRGELKLEGRTWESLISEQGASAASWAQALDQFLLNPKGHAALLKNLANLNEFRLLDKRVLDALRAGAPEGKQLPFRYFSAYKRLEQAGVQATVLDAVEDCLNLSVGALPTFSGRVMSLCDNSGSAQGTTTSELGTMKVNQIANLTGVLTGMASDEGHVGIFGDRLECREVRKRASVFEQLRSLDDVAETIGGGTENGIWLFFKQALLNKEHWDHVFVYSDMQAGHGGLYGVDQNQYKAYQWKFNSRHIDVAKLIRAYHQQVNPNCKFYLVQVAGYQDTLAPDFYPNVVVLGGWGPGLLKFAHAMGQASVAA